VKAGTVPELPAWLVDIIRAPKVKHDTGDSGRYEQRQETPYGAFGTPNAAQITYARGALEKACDKLAKLKDDRNNELNNEARSIGSMVDAGALNRSEVEHRLLGACYANGEVDRKGAAQCKATIKSGLDSRGTPPKRYLELAHGGFERVEPAADTADIESLLLPLIWHSNEQLILPECLVEDFLTEATIGYIAGESTAGKTFIAIYLAFCVALGLDFFSKKTKRGGVLYVVPEAPGTIPSRMEAARMNLAYSLAFETGELTLEEANNLPIVRIAAVPNLATDKGLQELTRTAKYVAAEMPKRFGIPLRLVVIDTALAGFGIKDWNSPGDVALVTSAMDAVRNASGAACLSVAHHGKDISKGIAGSFAIKAGAHTVLSVLAEFEDVLSGVAKCRHVVLTKWRDGEAGWQSEFTLTKIKVGEIPAEPENKPVFSAHVTPVEDGIKLAAVKKGKIGLQ
jgi:hypothetical protein